MAAGTGGGRHDTGGLVEPRRRLALGAGGGGARPRRRGPPRVGGGRARGRPGPRPRRDVTSPVDQPPWDNSAMDGYAARAEDVRGASDDDPVRLTVVDDIPAGGFPSRPIGPGEAAKIMTGAPVPEGADSVVRVEHTDAGDRRRDPRGPGRRPQHPSAGRGPAGGGPGAGRPAPPSAPPPWACWPSWASRGPRVVRRPVVAILSNGDELASLDEFDEVRAAGRS
jgi:molybdopterin molybdotransferase